MKISRDKRKHLLWTVARLAHRQAERARFDAWAARNTAADWERIRARAFPRGATFDVLLIDSQGGPFETFQRALDAARHQIAMGLLGVSP